MGLKLPRPIGEIFVVAAVAVGFSACQQPTQITLSITTDLDCSLKPETAIIVGTSSAESETPGTITETCVDGRIGAIVLLPKDDKEGKVFVRVVTGLGQGYSADDCLQNKDLWDDRISGKGCIIARRSLNFIPQTPLFLPVKMRAVCLGTPCTPTSTCVAADECEKAEIDNSENCAEPGACALPSDNAGGGGTGGMMGTSSTASGMGGMTSSSSMASGMGGMMSSSSTTSGMAGMGGMMGSSSTASGMAGMAGMGGMDTTGSSGKAGMGGMGGLMDPTGGMGGLGMGGGPVVIDTGGAGGMGMTSSSSGSSGTGAAGAGGMGTTGSSSGSSGTGAAGAGGMTSSSSTSTSSTTGGMTTSSTGTSSSSTLVSDERWIAPGYLFVDDHFILRNRYRFAPVRQIVPLPFKFHRRNVQP